MRKSMQYTLSILFIIILIPIVLNLLNPLRKPEAQIKEDLLELMPVGMDMDDAIKVIESNKRWKLRSKWDEVGYSMTFGRPNVPNPWEVNEGIIIGKKSIRIYLGSYFNLFETGVSAYLGFDENSKLIDLDVKKETDSL